MSRGRPSFRGGWRRATGVLPAGGTGAVAVALIVLLASWALRGGPHTYSVGDQALLEIYTLHAARGELQVGPYSRFTWNHPGPALFYALAPGYVVSGERKDSLFTATFICNLACIVALFVVLRRYAGPAAAMAVSMVVPLLYFHPGEANGWDFGDLLSGTWNPHAVMLPLALLMAVSAAIGVGGWSLWPAAIALSAFVAQTHLGLVPVSCAMLAMAAAGPLLRRMFRAGDGTEASQSRGRAVVAMDVLITLVALLLVWLVGVGGFTIPLRGILIRVHSLSRPTGLLILLLIVRHVIRRRPVYGRRELDGFGSLLWRLPIVVEAASARRVAAWSLLTGLLVWSLPLADEISHGRDGNLSRIAAFWSEPATRDTLAGVAAFTYYLPGVLQPDLQVAAGGRTFQPAEPSRFSMLATSALSVMVALCVYRAIARRKTYLAWLGTVTLVAAATALWSLVRVRGLLYDHLGFWIVMIGLLQLVVIVASLLEWALARMPALERFLSGRLARAVGLAVFAGLTFHGVRHLVLGHQQVRYGADAESARALTTLVRKDLRATGLEGSPMVFDLSQEALPVATGVVLEFDKAGAGVAVVPDWLRVFARPLAPTGRERVEVWLASPADASDVRAEPGYHEVGQVGAVTVFMRPLSRADRVRLGSGS